MKITLTNVTIGYHLKLNPSLYMYNLNNKMNILLLNSLSNSNVTMLIIFVDNDEVSIDRRRL